MVKYHIATGDGKAYYGVNYESYREAEAVLRFSQKHDPQAHIVEEEYHFTNADRIRAMSDEELAELFGAILREREIILLQQLRKQGVEASIVEMPELTLIANLEWLKQPAEGE